MVGAADQTVATNGLEPPLKILCGVVWVREVREASYDMEDILDTYLVRVEGSRKHKD